MIRMNAKFGVEEIVVDYENDDGTPGPTKTIRADVVEMGLRLRKAYEQAKASNLDKEQEAALLNTIYADYGLDPLGIHAADALGVAIVVRGTELKNELWATAAGNSVPKSPDSTPDSTWNGSDLQPSPSTTN